MAQDTPNRSKVARCTTSIDTVGYVIQAPLYLQHMGHLAWDKDQAEIRGQSWGVCAVQDCKAEGREMTAADTHTHTYVYMGGVKI